MWNDAVVVEVRLGVFVVILRETEDFVGFGLLDVLGASDVFDTFDTLESLDCCGVLETLEDFEGFGVFNTLDVFHGFGVFDGFGVFEGFGVFGVLDAFEVFCGLDTFDVLGALEVFSDGLSVFHDFEAVPDSFDVLGAFKVFSAVFGVLDVWENEVEEMEDVRLVEDPVSVDAVPALVPAGFCDLVPEAVVEDSAAAGLISSESFT